MLGYLIELMGIDVERIVYYGIGLLLMVLMKKWLVF